MGRTMLVGLTGGIGSGKSTVAGLLAQAGASVVDADAIARAATAPGGAALAAIAQQFGAGLLDARGALDRDAMRALVFSDASAKARLEAIIHPLVGQQMLAQAAQAQAAGSRCVLLDIPLLVEGGHWRARLQRVLVVDCTPPTQVARVVARSGLSVEAIQAIQAAQATRAQRLAAADYVLYNEGISLENLRLQVQELAREFGL